MFMVGTSNPTKQYHAIPCWKINLTQAEYCQSQHIPSLTCSALPNVSAVWRGCLVILTHAGSDPCGKPFEWLSAMLDCWAILDTTSTGHGQCFAIIPLNGLAHGDHASFSGHLADENADGSFIKYKEERKFGIQMCSNNWDTSSKIQGVFLTGTPLKS